MRGAGWEKVCETKASDNWLKSRPGRKQSEAYKSNKWRWETHNPEYVKSKDRPRSMILPAFMTDQKVSLQMDMFEVM
jgi:hypothetical protein